MKLLTILVCMASTLLVWGDDTPIAAEEMTVRLIELDVKVLTLGGRDVFGVDQSQFEVIENGKKKDIVYFEEIDLNLEEGQLDLASGSNVMVLLDAKNASYSNMLRVFPQLVDYAEVHNFETVRLGLAMNLGGIDEYTAFTKDKQQFLDAVDRAKTAYGKSHYRFGSELERLYATTTASASPQLRRNSTQGRHAEAYYRREMSVLGQFVNYLGAFSGKKDIIMVSELWQNPEYQDQEGNTDQKGTLSLKNIQSTCLFNQVAINVIAMRRGTNVTSADRSRPVNDLVFIDRTSKLAYTTSGHFVQGSHRAVSRLLEQTAERRQRFYRIHYYSDEPGTEYRRIKVKVDGLNRVARTFSGYYPQATPIDTEISHLDLSRNHNALLKMKLNTSWMQWERAGWKKKQAYYALALRAFDNVGTLVSEKVIAGQLLDKKKDGHYGDFVRSWDLQVSSNDQDIERLELTLLDLTSGDRVTTSLRPSDI